MPPKRSTFLVSLLAGGSFVTSLTLASESQIKTASFFASPTALPQNLVFRAEEIPLPEFGLTLADRLDMTDNGDVIIGTETLSGVKPAGENWIVTPEAFRLTYVTDTGFLAGEHNLSGDAIWWEPIGGYFDFVSIRGDGFRYCTRGLSKRGSILLTPLNAVDAPSILYQANGDKVPLDALGYGFDTANLTPLRLQLDGSIHGAIRLEENLYHPFSIISNQLVIDESLELTSSQAATLRDFSENGHGIMISEGLASGIFGPRIDSIENVDSFHAYSINNDGYAVGESMTDPSFLIGRAQIWTPDHGLRDLNDLTGGVDYNLVRATTIHNNLKILAVGIDSEDALHLYVLTIDDSSFDSIRISTRLESSSLVVIATPDFAAQNVKLQQRVQNGEWTDLSLSPTQPSPGAYQFEIPAPAEGTLLRVSATQSDNL